MFVLNSIFKGVLRLQYRDLQWCPSVSQAELRSCSAYKKKKKIPAYLKQLNCFDNLKWTDFLEFPDLLCSVVIFAVVFCLELNVKNIMFKIMCLKGKNNGFQGRSGACRTHLIKKKCKRLLFQNKNNCQSCYVKSDIRKLSNLQKKEGFYLHISLFADDLQKACIFLQSTF